MRARIGDYVKLDWHPHLPQYARIVAIDYTTGCCLRFKVRSKLFLADHTIHHSEIKSIDKRRYKNPTGPMYGYTVRFKLTLNDTESQTIVKSVSIRGAKKKFHQEWPGYKIIDVSRLLIRR